MGKNLVVLVATLFVAGTSAYPTSFWDKYKECFIPEDFSNTVMSSNVEAGCSGGSGCCILDFPTSYTPGATYELRATRPTSSDTWHLSVGATAGSPGVSDIGTISLTSESFSEDCDITTPVRSVGGQIEPNKAITEYTFNWTAPTTAIQVTLGVSCSSGFFETVMTDTVTLCTDTVPDAADIDTVFTDTSSLILTGKRADVKFMAQKQCDGYLMGLVVPTGVEYVGLGFQDPSGSTGMAGTQIVALYNNGGVKLDGRIATASALPPVDGYQPDMQSVTSNTNRMAAIFRRPNDVGNDNIDLSDGTTRVRLAYQVGDSFGPIVYHLPVPDNFGTVDLTALGTTTTTTQTTIENNISPLRHFDSDNSIIVTSPSGPTIYYQVDENNNRVRIGVSCPKGNQWCAFGFQINGNKNMAGTQIISISKEGAAAAVNYRAATGRSTPGSQTPAAPTDSVETRITDDAMEASFYRPFNVNAEFFNLEDDAPFGIPIAFRNGDFGSFSGIHSEIPIIYGPITFAGANKTANGELGSSGSFPFIANQGNLAHGAIMILAWMALSPIGSLMARYMKHIDPTWFKLHIALQVFAVIFTIIGLILIIESGVEYDDLQDDSLKHARMGFAVIALSIFQVFLGAARNQISGKDASDPDDKGERRWIFNWLHKTNGVVLIGLSLSTIHLGITLFDVPEAFSNYWIQEPAEDLFFAYIGVLGGIILLLEIMYAPNWDMWGPLGKNKTEDESVHKTRTIMVSLASAFILGVTIALWAIFADTEAADSIDGE